MIVRRSTPPAEEVTRLKGFDDFELKLGDIMRGERATLGKSLLDVQRELRIKATYIAAIENTDPSAFETPSFIAGYVRSYAKYLGMNPDETFARFCDEAKFTVAHGMSQAASGVRPPVQPQSRGSAPRPYADPLADPHPKFIPAPPSFFSHFEPRALGSVAVLVGLIGLLGYGGWSVLQQVQRVQLAPVNDAPQVAVDLDPLAPAGGAVQMAEADPVRPLNEALDRLYRPEALDLPVLEARDGPIAAIRPEATGVLAGLVPPAPGTAPAAAPGEAVPVQVVAAAAPALEILAVRPAWVRVQAADGTVILEKILDAGERYEVPATEEPPVLRAGNSGAVYFAVNGVAYGPAAPGASVVKNLQLSPEALTGTYEVADLAKDPELARIVALAEAATD